MAPKRGASREPSVDPAQPQRSSRRLRGNSEDPNLSPLSKGLEPVRRKTTKTRSASKDQPTNKSSQDQAQDQEPAEVEKNDKAEVQAGENVDNNDQQNTSSPKTVSLVSSCTITSAFC